MVHLTLGRVTKVTKGRLLFRSHSLRRHYASGVLAKIEETMDRLTAYDQVNKSKELINQADQKVIEAREALKLSRHRYENTVQRRKEIQQQVTSLLHRKQNWTSVDLKEFTELCQMEHTTETEELALKQEFSDAEQGLELSYSDYMNALREHYHEEQIWSEKGRRLSTYGTWGLILFNSMLFVLSVTVVEPRKRTHTVEEVTARIMQIQESTARKLLDDYQAQVESSITQLKSNDSSTRIPTKSAGDPKNKPRIHFEGEFTNREALVGVSAFAALCLLLVIR